MHAGGGRVIFHIPELQLERNALSLLHSWTCLRFLSIEATSERLAGEECELVSQLGVRPVVVINTRDGKNLAVYSVPLLARMKRTKEREKWKN